MRRILPLLALAACSTPARTGPSGAGGGDRAAAGAAAQPPADRTAPMAARLRALIPHLAPGDPVTLAIRFGGEIGTVTRIDPLEVVLARPDGTTQRARAAVSLPASSVFELPAAGRFDLALAGRYRFSLTGVAHGDSARRFV